MHYIADLEIHSKYSRAVSKNSDLEHHEVWAKRKGLDVVGTGDFTHPAWLKELKEKLEPAPEQGLYVLKGSDGQIKFSLTAEVSCVYTQGRGRRVHILLYAPSLEVAEKISHQLGLIGNIKSDGRPILGLSCEKLAEIVFKVSSDSLIIPAHIWTPWFGILGSKSGFDSLDEAFGAYSDRIYAVESGLSSDPPMNWRLSALDSKQIVSYSDAHSPPNLGREATVYNLETLNYENIAKAIRHPDSKNAIAYTIEFFPQEGMYHYDGHRDCDVRFSPAETTKNKNLCPKCGRAVTVGVMNRVAELADRPENYVDPKRPSFKSLVPLPEIIADAFALGKKTKKVETEYEKLLQIGGSEFNILLKLSDKELDSLDSPKVVAGIKKMRQGDLVIDPGYDGVYGTVKIFSEKDKASLSPQAKLL